MPKKIYESIPDENYHTDLFNKVFKIILKDAVFDGVKRENPVVRWREPENLRNIFDFKLNTSPCSDNELLILIRQVIKFSVKTGHPYFVNQLFSGLDPYGLIGQIVTDALNPSVYTYEVAPVFTLMETEVISEMLKLVQFEEGDGIFCPGGSFANGFGINIARYHFLPEIKSKGLHKLPKLVLFTSEDCHYSVQKLSSLLGLGEDNVISVKVDHLGRMIVADLDVKISMAINDDALPFLVLVTAGTTVLGAIDPIHDISDVCKKYKLWLHVDAAWGGGLLFSNKHKHLLSGIEECDSITWNPHKLLAVPQQCSVLLTKHKNLLHNCHSKQADYLFQKDKFYDTSYDVGDKYVQCGRRADVFKFWLMWKAKGSAGLEQHVDKLMDNSRYLVNKLQDTPGFVLVSEAQFINVCFWFVPEHMRHLTHHPDYYEMLHKVAPKIKEKMMRRGSMMISYQPLRIWPNFFRFVCQNSAITDRDIDYFVNEIITLGNDIDVK